MAFSPMRSVVAATFHSSSMTAQATPVWTDSSIRTGVIAKKKGMTSVWSETGVRMPVTVLQVNHCTDKNLCPQQLGICRKFMHRIDIYIICL